MSIKVANGTAIVLSDMRIVKELLDDHSNETSSRPTLHAADSVTGKNYFALATSDNKLWQIGRKVIQPLVSSQAVQSHLPIAERETAQLLYDLLERPDDLCSHVSRATLSFVTSVVFGKPTPQYDSPEAELFRTYMRSFSATIAPAAAPVDLVPLLKYVPEICAPWKRLWKRTRNLQRSLYFSLLEFAESQVGMGHRNGTLMESILSKKDELGLTREMVGYIGGIMLDGGAETSAALIQSLILCLLDSPESQKRAQQEIDSVVGLSRLPQPSDIQDLPYVQAMIKEIHRLRPAGPLGIPHSAKEDFSYGQYIIPKGAPIFTNVWGILHDPNLFERPDEFFPERYLMSVDGTIPGLQKGYTIRTSLPFGSGKRLCPGMHLATTNISLAVMRLLWAFDFSPLKEKAHVLTSTAPSNLADHFIDVGF
uniref:Cytochrome P450 n=1 Tax=Psilocybe cubensis TaxID=181762 RepID=A0A8H8CEA0_PSICU